MRRAAPLGEGRLRLLPVAGVGGGEDAEWERVRSGTHAGARARTVSWPPNPQELLSARSMGMEVAV